MMTKLNFLLIAPVFRSHDPPEISLICWRNIGNMLIFCSRNISYYYQCWKALRCLIFLVFFMTHLECWIFCNIIMSLLPLLIHFMHICWIKVLNSLKQIWLNVLFITKSLKSTIASIQIDNQIRNFIISYYWFASLLAIIIDEHKQSIDPDVKVLIVLLVCLTESCYSFALISVKRRAHTHCRGADRELKRQTLFLLPFHSSSDTHTFMHIQWMCKTPQRSRTLQALNLSVVCYVRWIIHTNKHL